MQKHFIDITELTNFKDILEKSASLADKKNDEIVILVDQTDFKMNNALVLQVLYSILGEGILNYYATSDKPRNDFDYNSVDILDYNMLANELTKLTGIKFSSQKKELVN